MSAIKSRARVDADFVSGKLRFRGSLLLLLHAPRILNRRVKRRDRHTLSSPVRCVFAEEERERERRGKRETEFPSLPLTAAAHGRYTAITRRCIDPAVRSPTVRRIPRARWRATLSLPTLTPQRNTLSFEKEREEGARDGECVSSPGRASIE